jgi:hypothetical protein
VLNIHPEVERKEGLSLALLPKRLRSKGGGLRSEGGGLSEEG